MAGCWDFLQRWARALKVANIYEFLFEICEFKLEIFTQFYIKKKYIYIYIYNYVLSQLQICEFLLIKSFGGLHTSVVLTWHISYLPVVGC